METLEAKIEAFLKRKTREFQEARAVHGAVCGVLMDASEWASKYERDVVEPLRDELADLRRKVDAAGGRDVDTLLTELKNIAEALGLPRDSDDDLAQAARDVAADLALAKARLVGVATELGIKRLRTLHDLAADVAGVVAERDRYKERVEELTKERDELRWRFEDLEEDFHQAIRAQCSSDEKHCSCVPHLRKRIAELEAQAPRWRPVSEAPERGGYYLCVCNAGARIAFWGKLSGWQEAIGGGAAVTHWMPLPDPPQDGEDEDGDCDGGEVSP